MTGLFVSLILAATTSGRASEYDFSMDLFLVGHDGQAIREWDWIDEPHHVSAIQVRLLSEIKRVAPYASAKTAIRNPRIQMSYRSRLPAASTTTGSFG